MALDRVFSDSWPVTKKPGLKTQADLQLSFCMSGAPRGIRTPNRQIRSYNIGRESRQSQ
jgi:hypothetical protein